MMSSQVMEVFSKRLSAGAFYWIQEQACAQDTGNRKMVGTGNSDDKKTVLSMLILCHSITLPNLWARQHVSYVCPNANTYTVF